MSTAPYRLDSNGLLELRAIARKNAVNRLHGKPKHKHLNKITSLRGGVKPVDLYCYLYARFGKPNGIQNLLRRDSTDNFIHWNYTLELRGHTIDVLAMNYRIEFHIPASMLPAGNEENHLVDLLRIEFAKYGKQMGAARDKLEKWIAFINPHQQVTSSLDSLAKRAIDLHRNTPRHIQHPTTQEESNEFQLKFKAYAKSLHEMFGLCHSIRMLAAVSGESFINLIIYILAKPEIKKDKERLNTILRSHIDVRIKELHLNCRGFTKEIDRHSDAYKNFFSLINRRNDLLHGNVLPEQTQHEVIFFEERIPLFTVWRDFYDRIFGAQLKLVPLEAAKADLDAVKAFKEHVYSCFYVNEQDRLRIIVESTELGENTVTKQVSPLFDGIPTDQFFSVTKPMIDHTDAGAGI